MRNSTDYTIRDAGQLAGVVNAIIRDSGTETAAARRLGVSQGYVNKLRHSRVRSIGVETYFALDHAARKLPGGVVYDLREAFVSPEAEAALATHRRAVSAELRRYGIAESAIMIWVGLPGRDPFPHQGESAYWLWHDVGAAPPIVGIVNRLFERFPRLFVAFHRWADLQWPPPAVEDVDLLLLAVARIAAPFLLAATSGGIERGLDDLTDRELRDYLDAAFRAEKVLLSREPALTRARLRSGDSAPATRRQRVTPRRRRVVLPERRPRTTP